jgi:2-iminobutanoate/2-iminopropanoate deaminase
MLKTVATSSAPAAIGPYSQAVIAGNTVYASGQIPIVPETGMLAEGSITVQAEQAIKNVGEILKAAGASFSDVVKTTCFLADMNDFAAFNAVYEKYFIGRPARSCVAVKTLPKGALCEVEAVAVLG